MSESKRRIGSNLKKVDAHVIAPHEYDEAPEFMARDFAKAEVRDGEKLVRRGRPPLDQAKLAIKLRLDADIIGAYRATGEGWQTRINADLRRARRLDAPQRRKARR
jgi:uncharacterized protein (DUF4415 family)